MRTEEHVTAPQIKEEEKDIEWDSDKETESTIPDEGSESRPKSIYEITRGDGVAAIREVFSSPESSAGLDREAAIREVAASIGFERVGPRIRQFIEGDLIAAARQGVIFSDSGMLYPAYRSITEYPRDLLKKCLLSVMGSAWWDQDEAIRAAARYLGFRGRKVDF